MRKTSRWITVVAFSCATALTAAGCTAGTPSPNAASPSVTSTTTAGPTASPSNSAGPTSPPPTARPPAAPPGRPQLGTVQISRSGGITGLNQTLVISPDGAWVLTNRKTGKTSRGSLSSMQIDTLRTLLSDTRLSAEARVAATARCNDGIMTVVTVGDLSLRDDGCGTGNRPATNAVIRFVMEVTGM